MLNLAPMSASFCILAVYWVDTRAKESQMPNCNLEDSDLIDSDYPVFSEYVLF